MCWYAAISGNLTGSQHLWMGGNTVRPGQKSSDHHHGEADSGIYVVSGHPRFVFLVDGSEHTSTPPRRLRVRARLGPAPRGEPV